MLYEVAKQTESGYLLTHDQHVTLTRIDREWENSIKWQASTIDGPYWIKKWATTKEQALRQLIDYLNRFN